MRTEWKRLLAWLSVACLVTAGCALTGEKSGGDEGQESARAGEDSQTAESAQAADAGIVFAEPAQKRHPPLRDNKSLYESDVEGSVVTMYLTVRRGNSSEGTDHSWEEINRYSAYDYNSMGVDRYQVEGILQVGDETGPLPGELGYGERAANATVQIRGQTSSRNAQKNYKIRLKDNKGTWRGQQTIALNKHQSDGLRFRNKLYFDLLKGLDEIVSLRTQFVHLYVKDETGGASEGFVDYGLYTQVEQLNKTALKARGMDRNGHLYKVNFFEFYRFPDVIRTRDDPEYDEKAFESMIETKGDKDHSKLIRMLEDVNNYSIPIGEVLEKHFDVENLTYWMAFQILTGNVDTQCRNFYIYSPKNLETWYFLPWDGDASLKWDEDTMKGRTEFGSWERGVSNYWGNVLFNRCLRSEEFRGKLDEAILAVKDYLSKERFESLIGAYRGVTGRYVYEMPDVIHEPLTPQEYESIAGNLPNLVDFYYENYLDTLECPMPFYIGTPQEENGMLKIRWDISFDFQAEDITYEAVLARDYLMQDVVAVYEGVWPEMEAQNPGPGQYFVKVKSKNASGHEQSAFDYYVTEDGKVHGVKCFYILEDGSIEEDKYEE